MIGANWRKYTATELAEIRQKEFLTPEVWGKWKLDLDGLLAFRKTIKGKPTDEQMFQLELNKVWITFYKRALFGDRS